MTTTLTIVIIVLLVALIITTIKMFELEEKLEDVEEKNLGYNITLIAKDDKILELKKELTTLKENKCTLEAKAYVRKGRAFVKL